MRAAVAGAGIAGLTAAIALARRGWSVELFERADANIELGAGIQLSPNAMAVLERLGLTAALAPAAFEPEAVAIYDAPSGQLLNRVPLGEFARRRYGAPYAVIARGDLQAGMLAVARRRSGIALFLDAEVSEVHDDGDRVTFCAGGETRSADILVAADGIRSRIRSNHFGHSGPRSLGKTAWRATIAMADVPHAISRHQTGLWLGPGAHLVHYPLRAGSEMNLVVISGEAEAPRPPAQPFGTGVRALMDAAPTWRRWRLEDIDAGSAWTRGGVVLIGDAAHAMPPSAAQGGAQAIEDAWVLAEVLGRDANPRETLSSYETNRRARVQRIIGQARRNLALYELHGMAALARNAALRALPARLHLARLDWLYGWKPDTKKG